MEATNNTQQFYNTEIPRDWEVKFLEEVTKFSQGVQVDLEKQLTEWQPGYLKFLRIENYTQKSNDFRFISEQDGRDKNIVADDIVIVRYGASAGYIGTGQDGVLANNLFKVDPNEKVLDKHFLFFLLTDFKAYKYFQNAMFGGAMPALSFEIVGNFRVSLPPLPEQKAISQVLSTADAAIHTTEKLIAQKELRKKWLMQQLLTGKKRLNGFDGEVKLKVVEHFLKEVSERNKDLKITNVLSVTNSRGFINQAEQFDRVVASEDATNYKIVRKGQFAYNPSRVNVGSLDLLRDFESGILSPMYVVFETDKSQLLPDYFYYQLKTQWFYGHIPMFVQGSVRDSLSFDGLCSMKFFIPSIEEQTAIAQVLQAADKETSLLKAKAEKLREQKKGLMQQLLTGKVRIKIK